MAKYGAILEAFGNPDHGEDPYRKKCNTKIVYKDSIEEMQIAVRRFIRQHDLGAGNIGMVKVIDLDKNDLAGCISYNGRWWEKGSKYCP